jgi:hypothetical protein
MIRLSLNRLIFLLQLLALILIYIAYILLLIYILQTRELGLVVSLWLIILSVIALLWISRLLLGIKIIKRHIRRLFVLNINLLFNNRLVWSIIGVFNKRFKLIKTIFLAYPANHKFAKEYVSDSVLEETRWHPWLTGFFIQNGRVGLKFAISSTESDFRDNLNIENLRSIWLKMSYLKHLLESDQMTFAGILPGLFYKKNIIQTLPVELDNTVVAVKKVVLSIMAKLNLDINTPIVVLGGKGFIGNKLIHEMQDNNVYCVDIKDNDNKLNVKDIIDSAENKVIILNIATQKALIENLIYFNEKVIIINEVYPEPSTELINKIKSNGSIFFHIVGVKGKSFPKFPRAYRNGIPCCASWNSNSINVEFIKI